MRLSKSMMAGAGLGAIVGVAGTVISLFRFDPAQTSMGEALAVGMLIGLPITVVGGVLAGWVWDVLMRRLA